MGEAEPELSGSASVARRSVSASQTKALLRPEDLLRARRPGADPHRCVRAHAGFDRVDGTGSHVLLRRDWRWKRAWGERDDRCFQLHQFEMHATIEALACRGLIVA